jgi:catechol 2,3-dioxygenase
MSDTVAANPTLHHVTLKTTRPDEMLAWYGKLIGMRPNHNGPFGAWLTNDDANHRVALLLAPGLEDDPNKLAHTGMHHMAFEYPDLGGLLSTYERLKNDGVEPHACLDHGMTISLYYVDPDGNSVELQVDNFGDWTASSEWMRTAPEFETNPIGISFDPDLVVAAWKSDRDAAELHRRCFSGEFDPGATLDLRLPAAETPAA